MLTVAPEDIVSVPPGTSCIVQAPPGSGKTWLLVERIKFLAAQSQSSQPGLVCITYTNAAADEILSRLPSGVPLEFVGTIHSFLLNYVLYPYGHLLPELPRDWRLVTEGYAQEHVQWMVREGHISREKAHVSEVLRAFERIGYTKDGQLRNYGGGGLRMLEMSEFVKRRLSEGDVSQQDVLWFSYELLSNPDHSHILNSLACRCGTILVDEFQDTTELQYEILERIHGVGRTALFLVGDPDQSVFSFAGAHPDIFRRCVAKYPSFRLTGCRRSTRNIVGFLDMLRNADASFYSIADWKDLDLPIYFLVGKQSNSERLSIFKEIVKRHGLDGQEDHQGYFVLARGRELAAELTRLDRDTSGRSDELLTRLDEGHHRLHSIVKPVLQACKFKQMGNLGRAFGRLDHALSLLLLKASAGFGDPGAVGLTPDEWRLMVVAMLSRLDAGNDLEVRAWVPWLKAEIIDCVLGAGGVKSGRKLMILDSIENQLRKRVSYSVRDAILAVTLPDETESPVRTIHGAKGLERDSVLVVASGSPQCGIWLNPGGIERNEEARVGYVALSRARKLLCVATEGLSSECRKRLKDLEYVALADAL